MRAALARRGPDAAAAVDRVLELDEGWREIRTALEELKAEQNRASRGRKAPKVPGVVPCEQVPIGTIDEALAAGTTTP